MKEVFAEIDLLRRREIEIKILAPVINAFAAEIGKERAFDIAGRAIRETARRQGAEAAALYGGGLDSFREKCIAAWNKNGELECEFVEVSGDMLRFNVTGCAFAKLYMEMGCEEIGALVSCDRDHAFIEGFDDSIELIRNKTIMAGDGVCDFCYRKKDGGR